MKTISGMQRYLLAAGILTAIKDAKAQADKAVLQEVYSSYDVGCQARKRYVDTLNSGFDEYIPWALDYCAHNACEISVQYEDGMISKEQFLHDLASWLFERADD